MNKNIKLLIEDYFSGTEQMNMSIKNQMKVQKKADKAYEERQQFLISVLGKATYNKYVKQENFAPIPMSALHITFNDLYYLFTVNNIKIKPMDNADGIERVKKLVQFLNNVYTRNEFKLLDNGVDYNVYTNLVFKSLDEIIDFFKSLQKGVYKIAKTNKLMINWKPIIKKFKVLDLFASPIDKKLLILRCSN